jgi:hypothetical protein
MFAADGQGPLMIDVEVGEERFALPYASITEARLVGVRELYLKTPSRTVVIQGLGLIPLLVGLCNHRLSRLFVTRDTSHATDEMRIDRILTTDRDADAATSEHCSDAKPIND